MIKKYDVVGIGNAIADVLCHVDDDKIKSYGLTKGSMTLIDEDRAKQLYSELTVEKEMSGGSCANVIAGLASFGSKTAFIGKVRNDQLGEIYKNDLEKLGVDYITEMAKNGPDTAMSFIMITPDTQRTMSTYLGTAPFLDKQDIDQNIIKNSKMIYVEGYLWDKDTTKDAIRTAFKYAKSAGCKIGFNLSDVFCVERHRDEFLSILKDDVDLVFGNIHEMEALFKTKFINQIYSNLKNLCELSVVTKSSEGSAIITRDKLVDIEPYHYQKVVDSTGAGDLYVSGFLYAYLNEYTLQEAGKLASMSAGEVISHVGARPLIPLKDFLENL